MSRDDDRTPIKKLKLQKVRHKLSKQKQYAQKFRPEWKQHPHFKGWLTEHPSGDKTLCMCTACNAELKCGKSELVRHTTRAKHKKNVAKVRGLQPVTALFNLSASNKSKVTTAEIKLANLLAHHNVAYQFADHLIPVLKDCFPDSSILKDVQLGRTKTVNIIKNVIAHKETADLSKLLATKYFSVLIDESTDVAINKLLCIVVKYVDDYGKICDKLLQMLLFLAFSNCLTSKGISISNVIGLSSDNASVMVGKNNSFMTRLQAETKTLVVLPCICHSSALVASRACLKLSRTPEEFLRNMASYFSVSAKRSAQLAEMQFFFLSEQKKMLKLSVTRWLCMQHVVERVLENWDVLIEYFRLEMLEENSKVVATLSQSYSEILQYL